MKILHINSYYSGSSFYRSLYEKQKENGLDIEVYVPVSKAIDSTKLSLGNFTTLSVNHSKYDRIIFHLKHLKIYKDILERYNIHDFSVVHAHSLFSNGYIAYKLKKEFGIPYIVAVRNTDVNTFFKYMLHLKSLGVNILKEAQKVIFLSKSYRDLVIGRYVPDHLKDEILHKTEIIPNGIDDFWIKNINTPKSIEKNKSIKLIYVGVINKNKNIITTIKAIQLLHKRGYNVQFTVVGRIDNNDIYDQVINLSFLKYVPPIKKEELISIYRKNDIFVMPSISETFGLVYAEAISQGLPIVYSKGQGFDGQFKDGEVGYSVRSDSAEEIASSVEEILKNFESISKNCIENIDKFNWSNIQNIYQEIYLAIFSIKR